MHRRLRILQVARLTPGYAIRALSLTTWLTILCLALHPSLIRVIHVVFLLPGVSRNGTHHPVLTITLTLFSMALIDSRTTDYNNTMPLFEYLAYALLSCFAVATLLLLRHVWTRHSSNDPEMSASNLPGVEKLNFDLPLPASTQATIDDDDLLKALFDNHYTPLRPVTSGFLAAKADMERADGSVGLLNEPVDMAEPDMDVSLQPASTLPRGFFDEDDTASGTSPTHYYSSSPSKSRLQEDARQDQSQHFQDPNDLALIWRRRTMIFGSVP